MVQKEQKPLTEAQEQQQIDALVEKVKKAQQKFVFKTKFKQVKTI